MRVSHHPLHPLPVQLFVSFVYWARLKVLDAQETSNSSNMVTWRGMGRKCLRRLGPVGYGITGALCLLSSADKVYGWLWEIHLGDALLAWCIQRTACLHNLTDFPHFSSAVAGEPTLSPHNHELSSARFTDRSCLIHRQRASVLRQKVRQVCAYPPFFSQCRSTNIPCRQK